MKLTLRHIKYCALATVAAMGLSGCGSKDNTPVPQNLVPHFHSTIVTQTCWQTSFGTGVEQQPVKLGVSVSQGQVAVGSYGGRVGLFNADSGQKIWSVDMADHVTTTPVMSGDEIFVGTLDGQLFALNRKDGKTLWHEQLGSSLLAKVAVAKGIVVAHVHNGDVVAFDAKTGKQLWIHSSNVPDLILMGDAAPVITQDTVLIGQHSGSLLALSLQSGTVKWSRPIALPSGGTAIARMVDIVGQPVVQDSKVYVATYQGNLAALDVSSGKVLWQYPESTYRDLTVGKDHIYLTDTKSHVWALSKTSGHAQWVQNQLSYRSLTAPAILGNYIVVGDYAGFLHWLRLSDGLEVARQQYGSAGMSSPITVANGKAYFYTNGGQLVCVKAG